MIRRRIRPAGDIENAGPDGEGYESYIGDRGDPEIPRKLRIIYAGSEIFVHEGRSWAIESTRAKIRIGERGQAIRVLEISFRPADCELREIDDREDLITEEQRPEVPPSLEGPKVSVSERRFLDSRARRGKCDVGDHD